MNGAMGMAVRWKRAAAAGAAALALLAALLAGPAATWLQRSDMILAADERPDAVYLVAGARAQNLRVGAVADFVRGAVATGGTMTVLIGNDGLVGPWSSADQRNLTMAEWAVSKLQPSAASAGGRVRLETVPGRFLGTDREMETLAGYLQAHGEIRSIALATSRFHGRRVIERLGRHLGRDVRIRLLPVRATGEDRAPWIVAGELACLARDAAGLGRVSFLTRRHP